MDAANSRTLRLDYLVPAAAKQVYRAFTHSTALREWMCDYATAVARVGGRFYAAWNEGYYTSGYFTQLQEDQVVAFYWFGRDDPGQTEVQISLEERAGGTQVTLLHSGFGAGSAWETAYSDIERGWNRALENLVSVVGSGPDLRITQRPMLGIMFSDFNAEIAKTIGVPVNEGTRLEGTLEGLGARAAGLQKNDVIVDLDGQPVRGFDSFLPILSNLRAGERVKVGYYRGMEKHEVEMLLAARPLPSIPQAPRELAEAVRQIYARQSAELMKVFEGASEQEADFHPSETEWSAKEVLAHLIISERNTNEFVVELASGFERVTDAFGEYLTGRVPAMAKTLPTLAAALAQYQLAGEETISTLEILPDSLLARKGSYWRLAYGMLTATYHLNDHREQIAAALRSAGG